MDAQQFLAEFGHIVNAPGGVARLREMVYQLAITGTLTLQNQDDGDACVLLAEIEISPRNDAQEEALASFIPMSGISQLHKGKLAPEAALWRNIKKGFTHFANGDVVVAKITPCFENGKAAMIDGLEHTIGAGTTELHVFRPIHPGILPGYVYLFLRSPYFVIEGERNMTGTAGQKRLPTEFLQRVLS